MDDFLGEIAGWFQSIGLHPVLGAFIAGALVAFVLSCKRSPGKAPAAVEITAPDRKTAAMVTPTTKTSVSIKKILGKALGVLILLGFLVGLLLVVSALAEMSKMAEAQEWPFREGVVTQSSASETFSRRRGDRWTFVIRGIFNDNGEKFVLTRVRYGEFKLGKGKAYSLAAVAKYPVGSEVRVYYSPAHPRKMILEPFAPWDEMVIVLGAGIGLVLIPVVLFCFRKKA
jgi:hypothetical protein